MKQSLIFIITLLSFFSCSVKEKPEFITVNNIKVVESTSRHITLEADALFKNPNNVGGQLQTDELNVIINGNKLAKVSTELFRVPSKASFTVPLRATIETKQLISDQNLSSLLGSLFSQKLNVQYKGVINYKVLGFSHRYPVDKTEIIKIKL